MTGYLRNLISQFWLQICACSMFFKNSFHEFLWLNMMRTSWTLWSSLLQETKMYDNFMKLINVGDEMWVQSWHKATISTEEFRIVTQAKEGWQSSLNMKTIVSGFFLVFKQWVDSCTRPFYRICGNHCERNDQNLAGTQPVYLENTPVHIVFCIQYFVTRNKTVVYPQHTFSCFKNWKFKWTWIRISS